MAFTDHRPGSRDGGECGLSGSLAEGWTGKPVAGLVHVRAVWGGREGASELKPQILPTESSSQPHLLGSTSLSPHLHTGRMGSLNALLVPVSPVHREVHRF